MGYVTVEEKEVFFDCEKLCYCKNKIETVPVYEPYVNIKYNEILSKLVLLISDSCNLCCRYCFSVDGAYSVNKKNVKFDKECLRRSLTKIFQLYPKGIRYLEFFGGEPLLCLDKIKQTVDIVDLICKERKVAPPIYSMVTNGVLLNKEVVKYLNNNNFFVTVSIDGNKETHDKSRCDFQKNGTYSRIMNNLLEAPLKHFYVEFSIYHTMLKSYSQGFIKECLEEYKKMGCHGIVSNLIVDETMKNSFRENKEKYLCLLNEYADCMIEEIFNENGMLFDFTFVNIILAVLQHKPMRPTCTEGASSITMGIDGEISPCYLSSNSLGNANEIEALDNLDYYSFKRPEECSGCWCHNLCQSWCREINDGKTYEPRCVFNQIIVERIIKKVYACHKEEKMKILIAKLKVLQNIESS